MAETGILKGRSRWRGLVRLALSKTFRSAQGRGEIAARHWRDSFSGATLSVKSPEAPPARLTEPAGEAGFAEFPRGLVARQHGGVASFLSPGARAGRPVR